MVLNNAEITGTVVQAVTNAGIKGAEISLIGREGNGSSSTVSDASGAYSISGMSPGSFCLSHLRRALSVIQRECF